MHTVHTYIIYIYTHKHGYHKLGMWTRAHGARVVTTIMLEHRLEAETHKPRM